MVKQEVGGDFSLTGAGGNCSSYQQPRRGRGKHSNALGSNSINALAL